jgi:hypothetical protein
MPTTYVNSGGGWYQAQEIFVKNGGTWYPVKQAWTNYYGTWYQVHPPYVPGTVTAAEWASPGTYYYTVPSAVYNLVVSGVGGGGHTCGWHTGGYCQYSITYGVAGLVHNVNVPVSPGGVCTIVVGSGGGPGFYNGGCGAYGTDTHFYYNGALIFSAFHGEQNGGAIYGGSGGAVYNGAGSGQRVDGCDGAPWDTYDVYSYAVYSGNYGVLGSHPVTISGNSPYAGRCRIAGMVQIKY